MSGWSPSFLAGTADILILALLIYTAIVLVKRTRAAFVLIGILIIGVVYVFAKHFQLWMTASVFQAFFTVILIAAVVLFQEELRYFFEQVALWGLKRRVRPDADGSEGARLAALLARTLADLSRLKVGALVVLRGNDLLARHLSGGIELGGRVSDALLKSIFDPHSAGHDGAVIIEEGSVTLFSAHLPLSKDLERLGQGGTRHAAALGLSERTDALCLVVSEERGTLSVAEGGRIRPVASAVDLERLIQGHLHRVRPEEPRAAFAGYVRRNSWEKIFALALSTALWFVNVHGAEMLQRTYSIPVSQMKLPAVLDGATVLPEKVDVTLAGLRRHFYFFDPESIRVSVRMQHLRRRTGTVVLGASDITLPEHFTVVDIAPVELAYHLERQKRS